MSEPIILTERERAVFASFATELERSKSLYRVCVGDAIREWIAGQPTESASPPSVPAESGPGQPMTYQDGFRAGIEAAAKWLFDHRARLYPLKIADAIAAIRALADATAPDPLLAGLERAPSCQGGPLAGSAGGVNGVAQ